MRLYWKMHHWEILEECVALRRRVRQLEEDLAKERELSGQLSSLLAAGEAARERMMLQAITGGAFDKKQV